MLVVETGAPGGSGRTLSKRFQFQSPGQRFQPPTKVDSIMQAVRQRFDQPEEQKKECDSDNGINSVFDQLCEVTNYGDFRNERPPKELLVHVKGRLKFHVDFCFGTFFVCSHRDRRITHVQTGFGGLPVAFRCQSS